MSSYLYTLVLLLHTLLVISHSKKKFTHRDKFIETNLSEVSNSLLQCYYVIVSNADFHLLIYLDYLCLVQMLGS